MRVKIASAEICWGVTETAEITNNTMASAVVAKLLTDRFMVIAIGICKTLFRIDQILYEIQDGITTSEIADEISEISSKLVEGLALREAMHIVWAQEACAGENHR